MQERTLFKLACTCTIIGLLALYIVLMTSEPEPANISDLAFTIGQVMIQGQVTAVRTTDQATTLTIMRQETQDIILFGKPIAPIQRGDHIQARGTPEQEGARISFFADEVRRLE